MNESSYPLDLAPFSRDDSLNLFSRRDNWEGMPSNTLRTLPRYPLANLATSSLYSDRILLLTRSASAKEPDSRYARTDWGIPPTSIYFLNWVIILRWMFSPRGIRFS